MLPTPGPGGSTLMLAPASARSLCTPQQGFHSPALPERMRWVPPCVGWLS